MVVLERMEDLSPFIYSLNYGAMIEELKLSRLTSLLSVHSAMFNKIYSYDILKAAQAVQTYAEAFTGIDKEEIEANNFNQTKKVILAAYNPNMTK